MNEIDGVLWTAFEQFAAKYPDDPGARMTLELARWVRERLALLERNAASGTNGAAQPEG